MNSPNMMYQVNGYKNRGEYLRYLAETNGLPLEEVCVIAFLLGPGEDFDLLVTAINDFINCG